MHILLLTNYFPPETAAAGHLYAGLAAHLVKLGHRVTVVTGFPRYRVADSVTIKPEYRRRMILREADQGFEILRIITLPLPLHIAAFRGLDHFFVGFSLFLGALLVKRPEVVLVYSPPLPLGLSAWLLQGIRKVPFVLNVQDIFPRYAVDSGVLHSPALIRFFEKLERFIYRRAGFIAAHSDGNRDFLVRHGSDPRKTTAVYNWSDIDGIRPGPKQNEFRRRHGLERYFLISYAGTLGYAQDVDTVVEAAALLQEVPEILFLFVGDGPEKPKLQAKVQKLGLHNVRFLPVQPYDQYALVLQASDACLVNLKPTLTTPVVPSKLLNIMASGRPVLANLPSGGDAARIIRDAGSGWCFEAGDARGLAAGILDLRRNPELARQFGKNGRRYVEAHFSPEACVKKYETLFFEVTRKGGKEAIAGQLLS